MKNLTCSHSSASEKYDLMGISILQLLLCLQARIDALLKLLHITFVPAESYVIQHEGFLNNISASNGLGFTYFDLPPRGRNHNMALHISIKCAGTTLS